MESVLSKSALIKIPTLHRLDLTQVITSYHSQQNTPVGLETGNTHERILSLLKRMVEIYNSHLGDKPKDYRFKELSLHDQLGNGINNQSFRIWCVRRQIFYNGTSLTPLLSTLGAQGSFSDSTNEIVIFFYRVVNGADEVFAIADGVSAWHLFSAYRDSTFARLVAKKMMAKPISHLKTRPLAGHKIQTESSHDGLYILEETKQGLAWVEGVKARIKAEALPTSFDRLHQKPPELTMQEKSLKFHCSFTFEEWCTLLNHLAELVQTAPSDQDTLDFEFLTSLQPADLTTASDLEEALCREVWRIFSSRDRIETALRFAPLNSEDYHQAETYSYSKIKNTSPNTWSQQLTTHELIHKLTTKKILKQIKSKINKSSEDLEKLYSQFTSNVKSVKIYYLKKGKCRSFVFIKCFQGEVFLSNPSQHFFQVKGQWLKPRIDFFAALHRSFSELLERSLIRPGHRYHNGHLPKPWSGRSSNKASREDVEGKYNLSYVDDKRFVVGDKSCPHNIELFDLLFHDPAENLLYLYQVKEKFGGGARAAAFQLMSSADGILATRNGDKTWLNLFSKNLQQYNKTAYDHFLTWGGSEKLEKLIQSIPAKNIVFVYALADASSKSRELSDELQLIRRLIPSDLDACIQSLSTDKHTSQQIFEYLKQIKFVDEEGRITTQGLTYFDKGEKKEFLNQVSKFLTTESDQASLYEYLHKLLASKFNSSIPRFSMLKAARHIEKHFSFAIDQIEQEKESLPPIDSLGTIITLTSLPVSTHPEWAPGSTFIWESKTYELEPTLDHRLSALHALLGSWNEEEGAYEWSVDSPREALVKKIQKKLKQEETLDSKPVQDAIYKTMEHFLYMGEQRKAPMLKNVNSFFKWLETDRSKKEKVRDYQKTLHENEKNYPKSKSLKDREWEILKATLADLKNKRGQGAAKYPNDFVKVLSGTEKIDQKNRISKITQYEQNEEILKADYQKNRPQLAEFLLKSTPQSQSSANLKKLFSAEEAEKKRTEQFTKLDPVNLFLESLTFKHRLYGLEEANVIRLLTKKSTQLYQADNSETHPVKTIGETVGSGQITRHIFVRHSTIETKFFVCSTSKDSRRKSEQNTIDSMDSDDEETCSQPRADAPQWMSLKNIGNSCYLDTVLQVLFASEVFADILNTYQGNHQNIKTEILSLLEGSSTDQRSIREALFSSKLHPELTMKTIEAQHDAAYIVELLMQEFFQPLPVTMYRSTSCYPGLIFSSKHDPLYYFSSSISSNSSLREVIWQTFNEEVNDPNNSWQCNPSKGIRDKQAISEEDAELVRKEPVRKISKFKNRLHFREMPDVLAVQLKRFHWTGTQAIKIQHEIRLPEDGILYMADEGPLAPESYIEYSGPKSRYQIVGYIVHCGKDLNSMSNHYTAFIQHKGQYYSCNDLKDKVEIITQDSFLTRRDAYILFFRRIS